jgi:hypothetical protein
MTYFKIWYWAGHTHRKPVASHWFHRTQNYGLIENDVLLNWKSHTHMNRLVHNCCNMTLRWMFSHNFVLIGSVDIFNPDNGDSMLLCKAGIYLRVHTASQSRRTTSRYSKQWEPQISPVCWSAQNGLDDLLYDVSFLQLISSMYDPP